MVANNKFPFCIGAAQCCIHILLQRWNQIHHYLSQLWIELFVFFTLQILRIAFKFLFGINKYKNSFQLLHYVKYGFISKFHKICMWILKHYLQQICKVSLPRRNTFPVIVMFWVCEVVIHKWRCVHKENFNNFYRNKTKKKN